MSHISLPVGKYVKIFTEIEHSPKHIFTQSTHDAAQYAWLFPHAYHNRSVCVCAYVHHAHTYAGIDYFSKIPAH